MVTLAKQPIDRQTTKYDPADLEDRYETRLRAMIDAKLKGEGINLTAVEPAPASNVIDLMAALKKSLGQAPEAPRQPKRKKAADDRQTGLKLPIRGGKGKAAEKETGQPIAKPTRKRA